MLSKEKKAGIYLTVSLHLLVIIILLITKIHSMIADENAFVIDFTRQEEQEKIEKQEQLRSEATSELDAMINGTEVRNVVVDASGKKGEQLRDDRFRNPAQVYDEARRLQEKLNASKREAEAYQGSDEAASESKASESKAESYKGPSVVAYNVAGRKALNLPIPAYKCQGGGDVKVAIVVNKKGYVIAAEVVYGVSSTDPCLQDYAVKAAKSSRFTASATAPDKQPGDILYRFISQ
jgi:outer membrane biosynthesis protein TonB